MTTGFWLLVTLLLLMSYVFFIPVFRRHGGSEALASREALNLELHRQREAELLLEVSDGEAREGLLQESARNLLGDLDLAAEKPLSDRSKGRLGLIITLCLLPMVILVSYLGLGQPGMIEPRPAGMAAAGDIEASIQRLAERLKEHPDDTEGWMLLGRSLEATQQFDKAARAYEFALKGEPDNVDIKAALAEVLAQSRQGHLAGRPAELVQEILRQEPTHKTALWMAGIALSLIHI